MHESSRILVTDLKALPQTPSIQALIKEAENDAFNDYFGRYALPQHILIERLKQTTLPLTHLQKMIDNIIKGKYDGTKAESTEWMASEEGQEAIRQIMGGDSGSVPKPRKDMS